MVKPMGNAPAANAVLNPKVRYARKNQQPVIPSEVACQAVALCEGWRNLRMKLFGIQYVAINN
jgi:hypothetical protein